MAESPRVYPQQASEAPRAAGGQPDLSARHLPDSGRTLENAAPIDPGHNAMSTPAAHPGSTATVREAIGVFDSVDHMQGAIDELTMAGIGQHEISLMASEEEIRNHLGHDYKRIDEIKDDPDVPRQAIVSPEEVGTAKGMATAAPAYVAAIAATGAVIASGGTALVAAAAAAAAAGAGGGVGAMLAALVGQQRDKLMMEHLDKGGILLWVNIRDEAREQVVREILNRHSSRPVEVHEIAQATG